MKLEINRRIFMAVLGAATAASATTWKSRVSVSAATTPGGICFFTEARGKPMAKPRTSAIIYLPADTGP